MEEEEENKIPEAKAILKVVGGIFKEKIDHFFGWFFKIGNDAQGEKIQIFIHGLRGKNK